MSPTDLPAQLMLTAALVAELARPFPVQDLDVRPGAVNAAGSAALVLPFARWRTYAHRLDTVVGAASWSIQLIPWGERRIIARLTICGVTKDASGEGDLNDPNCGTVAESQAKKRACAEFCLGRYLYSLPKIWGHGTRGSRKDFTFASGEAERCLVEMYRRAGVLSTLESAPALPSASHDRPALPSSTRVQPPPVAPATEPLPDRPSRPGMPAHQSGAAHKLAAARAALAQSEARATRHALATTDRTTAQATPSQRRTD